MKEKVTISVDKETLERIDEVVRCGKFRNRSHAFEFSLNKLMGGEND